MTELSEEKKHTKERRMMRSKEMMKKRNELYEKEIEEIEEIDNRIDEKMGSMSEEYEDLFKNRNLVGI